MSPVPAVILLMIVYMASLIGFTTPHQQAWYLYYTPYFLLLNGLILLLYQRDWNQQLGFFLASTMLLGSLVEGLGVHTGWLYGNYSFGETLGWKIAEVPAVLPVYWLVVVGSTAILAAKLLPNNSWGRILLSTALALGLTVLLQQVAAPLDFWFLESGKLVQYILVQSLAVALLQYLFVAWKVSSKNAIAGYVYGGLLIFWVGVVSFLQ